MVNSHPNLQIWGGACNLVMQLQVGLIFKNHPKHQNHFEWNEMASKVVLADFIALFAEASSRPNTKQNPRKGNVAHNAETL